MLNNGENKAMENGYVVLPIEKYNELIKAVSDAETTAKSLIRLETDYKGQIMVKFNSQQIYEAAKKLYESSSFNTPERGLIAIEKFSVYSSDLTHEVTTEDEE